MTADPRTVRVTHHFDQAAERVFDAWTDAATAGRWLFATPTGRNVRTDIDARVGGRFTVVDRRDGEDIVHVGTYAAIERPTFLAFDFQVPQFSDQSTRVSITIAALDSGCDLTLVHEGVLADYAERTQQGWSTMLRGLYTQL